MMARLKAFADKYVERFISRKFLAWVTEPAYVLMVQLRVIIGQLLR